MPTNRHKPIPHFRYRHWIVALAALMMLFGPGTAANAAGGSMTDSQIAVAVDSRLMRDDAVTANFIDVSVRNGIVTLSGSVEHLLARSRAVDVARNVRGVASVIDEIEVRPVPRTDEDIAADVRAALLFEPALAPEAFDIAVQDAQVTVTGQADSFQRKAICERTIYGVRGVKAVRNRIEVVPENRRADSAVRRDIRSRLRSDIWVDDEYIEVAAEEGRVVLRGRVASAAERQRAWSDAAVAGVHDIDASSLRVDPSLSEDRKPLGESLPSDEEIAEVLSRTFRQDPRIFADDLKVSVDEGTVLLQGRVKTPRARTVAEQDAENTFGVALVKNLLKVRPQIGSRFVPTPSYDAEMAKELRYALLRDPYVSQDQIGVSVQDSVVLLSGTVDSRTEKERAEAVVARKEGLILVKNRIKVRQGWARKSDDQIRSAIQEELFWSPFVDEEDVVVVVDDGVAILSGRADSLRERRAATKNAYDAGARRVVNRLEVSPPPARIGQP